MTWLILLLVIMYALFVLKKYIKSLSYGCCDDVEEVKVKKINVNDFPYEKSIIVEDMHCKNCKNNILHTFQEDDTIYLDISLKKHSIHIYSKKEIDMQYITNKLKSIGYHATAT